MLRSILIIFLTFFILSGSHANQALTFRQKVSLEQDVIKDAMIRAKEWQEAQHEGHVPTNWLTGTLYSGVFACFEATHDPMFLDAASLFMKRTPAAA